MKEETTLPEFAAPQAKPRMATDIPASITTPNSVETSLGTLRFFDGFPDARNGIGHDSNEKKHVFDAGIDAQFEDKSG